MEHGEGLEVGYLLVRCYRFETQGYPGSEGTMEPGLREAKERQCVG
jgi:hypothetical protein